MDIVIRENIEQYMKELKSWLLDMSDCELEEMGDFFTKRIDNYENHMLIWSKAYQRFAEILPLKCMRVLDLGCGTGLELDEIWKRNPMISVFGIDLCQSMLDKLKEKHQDKKLEIICQDYFQYNFGENNWDAVISFESLHHFMPERKKKLYSKIYKGLKQGGQFILGDYVACCDEEEALLQKIYFEKREKSPISSDAFVHFDIPLTLQHEIDLMQEAGFQNVKLVESIDGATIIVVEK